MVLGGTVYYRISNPIKLCFNRNFTVLFMTTSQGIESILSNPHLIEGYHISTIFKNEDETSVIQKYGCTKTETMLISSSLTKEISSTDEIEWYLTKWLKNNVSLKYKVVDDLSSLKEMLIEMEHIVAIND